MIFSFIGQPLLRLVWQLLKTAATTNKMATTKNTFFITLLLGVKKLLLQK
jgi:hypothetical protein